MNQSTSLVGVANYCSVGENTQRESIEKQCHTLQGLLVVARLQCMGCALLGCAVCRVCAYAMTAVRGGSVFKNNKEKQLDTHLSWPDKACRATQHCQ